MAIRWIRRVSRAVMVQSAMLLLLLFILLLFAIGTIEFVSFGPYVVAG